MNLARVIAVSCFLSFAMTGCVFLQTQNSTQPPDPQKPDLDLEKEFTSEITNVLDKKLLLLKHLSEDPLVVKATVSSSQSHESITQQEIDQIESKWPQQSSMNNSLIRQILTNDIALDLVRIEENYPGFTEVFISDQKGLVLASTLKTTDYDQSDEEWWQECIANGTGKAYYSKLSYDLSAASEGVAIYAPIYNKEQAIGCIKGFYDITALYHEILTIN